ncbi:thioredoxin-like protein [Xylariales sp. PMI_506]|nr:thioredoxin-like protein [Xylariales sp. PMI_506]
MEAEEPAPVLTLKERIAALKLAQDAANSPAPKERQPIFNTAKSKPPPPPLPKRAATGFASATGAPAPAPATQPVRRAPSDYGPTVKAVAPARRSNGPPPSLPPRRTPQPEVEEAPPALPPRRPSAPATLSAPPERGPQNQAQDTRSATARMTIPPPSDLPRRSPAPSAPMLPSRPRANQANPARADARPPPPPQRRSGYGDQGFDNAPPLPANRPQQQYQQQQPQAVAFPRPANPGNQPSGPLLVQLYANTFDRVVVNSGKPSFVDFYAPFCKHCKELDPIYEELAVKYQDEHITIAKIDSYTEKAIGERYEVQGWPTLYFFDGAGSPPVKFQWKRDMEWMSIFIDEQMSSLPAHLTNRPPSAVVYLKADTFDSVVLYSGKPAFVDFYAPFCKYCRELDPIFKDLAANYQGQNITVAKIDSHTQKVIGERYEVQSWPTLFFFDGTGGPPVKFQWKRDMEWMTRFVDEQMALLPAATYAAPPPVPMGSRPVF